MRVHAAAMSFLVAATVAAGETRSFGKPQSKLATTPLADILAKPEAGKVVRVEGTVEKVCQGQGCWLELTQGGRGVMVRMEGHAFGVPKDALHKPVVVEGRVIVKAPPKDEVEHLQAEGAGAVAAAEISIEATGVALR